MKLTQLGQNGTDVLSFYQSDLVFLLLLITVNIVSYDSNSGGEREIQRTMLELLNQLDGFDSRGDVKVMIKHMFIIKNRFIQYIIVLIIFRLLWRQIVLNRWIQR